LQKIWRLWAKALGQKEGRDEREADAVAIIRTAILFSYLVTNLFIISGVIRHWGKVDRSAQPVYTIEVRVKEAP
jgi:hypothetical protein